VGTGFGTALPFRNPYFGIGCAKGIPSEGGSTELRLKQEQASAKENKIDSEPAGGGEPCSKTQGLLRQPSFAARGRQAGDDDTFHEGV